MSKNKIDRADLEWFFIEQDYFGVMQNACILRINKYSDLSLNKQKKLLCYSKGAFLFMALK